MHRCEWCGDDPLYMKYHDEEWGVPVRDEQKMFEFFLLETFQAGLSWITILRKRENFRKAFADFDFRKIAKFTEQDRDRLLQDAGIIRNRLKIDAAIHNAKMVNEMISKGESFVDLFWHYVDHKQKVNQFKSLTNIPAKTELSDQISKDFKKMGFKFVGSTVIYAHMQATGMVNDHTTSCFRYEQIKDH